MAQLPVEAPPSVSKVVKAGSNSASECVWKAKRFAVKFQPPCIFLEYEDSNLKKRVREVKLSRVSPDVDPDRLTRKVIRSFPRQLDAASVKYDQVRKLVVKVLEHMQRLQHAAGHEGQQADKQLQDKTKRPIAPPLKTISFKPSLNTVASGDQPSTPNTPQLMASLSPTMMPSCSREMPPNRQSVESEDRFSTSSLGDRLSGSGCGEPGTDGHHASSQHPHHLGGASDIDDLDSALHELDKEFGGGSAGSSASRVGATPDISRDGSYTNLGFASIGSVTSTTSLASIANPQQRPASAPVSGSTVPLTGQAKTRFAEEADRLVLDVDVEGDVDLNKVTDVELKLAKMKMEQNFVKNQLRPGDPGFEYDKQVEFGPATEANDWDETEDEDADEAPPAPQAKVVQPAQPEPASIKAANPALSIQVQSGHADNDDDDDDDAYSYGDMLSETSPESVPDDVSPRRVAIDTDSSLELP